MADIYLETITYSKTEIDAIEAAETARVDAAIALKATATDIGSPSGMASLNASGEVPAAEIPFSTGAQAEAGTDETTVMNPARVADAMLVTSVPLSTKGQALGVAPLDASALVDASYLPDTTFAADIAALDARVTDNEADIVTNLAKITYDDAALVATHTTDIATNAADILTNTAAIALNTAKVSYTDAALVATHTTGIADNAADIVTTDATAAALAVDVGTNTTDITALEAVTATGWNDYTSIFSPASVSPSTTPAYSDMGNGIYALDFSVGDIAFISFHIMHDIEVGSNVYPHIHFSPAVAMNVGETISWIVDYVSAKGHGQAESLTAATTSVTLTYTADGTEIAGEHLVIEFSDAQSFTAPEVDSLSLFKIERGTGTYTGAVYGHTADLHYKVDKMATLNKAPSFYA